MAIWKFSPLIQKAMYILQYFLSVTLLYRKSWQHVYWKHVWYGNYSCYQHSNRCMSKADILIVQQQNEIFPWERNTANVKKIFYLKSSTTLLLYYYCGKIKSVSTFYCICADLQSLRNSFLLRLVIWESLTAVYGEKVMQDARILAMLQVLS